jgi:hypothetical protein
MAEISFTPFLDTEAPLISLPRLNSNFDVLDEINGSLASANLVSVAALDLAHVYIQRGAVSGGRMVAGTANLDYFNGIRHVFVYTEEGGKGGDKNRARLMATHSQGYLERLNHERNLGQIFGQGALVGDDDVVQISNMFPRSGAARDASSDLAVAIPGASISFFLPYDALVLLTWQVTWTSDAARFGRLPAVETFFGDQVVSAEIEEVDLSNIKDGSVAVMLFVNGSQHNKYAALRESYETMFAHPSDGDDAFNDYVLRPHTMRDRYKSRYWSGHALVGPLSKGFHTASLRVAGNIHVRQIRVRSRNMKYVYFKV